MALDRLGEAARAQRTLYGTKRDRRWARSTEQEIISADSWVSPGFRVYTWVSPGLWSCVHYPASKAASRRENGTLAPVL